MSFKNNFKKGLALTLALSLTLISLTGCGKKKEEAKKEPVVAEKEDKGAALSEKEKAVLDKKYTELNAEEKNILRALDKGLGIPADLRKEIDPEVKRLQKERDEFKEEQNKKIDEKREKEKEK